MIIIIVIIIIIIVFIIMVRYTFYFSYYVGVMFQLLVIFICFVLHLSLYLNNFSIKKNSY